LSRSFGSRAGTIALIYRIEKDAYGNSLNTVKYRCRVKDDLIAERISTIDIHLYILTIVFAFVAVILSWYCVKNIARNRLIGGALLMISFFVFLFSFFPL